MNLQKGTLLLAIFASLAPSCSKSDLSPLEQLTFKLVVLDENGEKRNVLKNGGNFSVGFEVVNHSDDSVSLSHEDGKKLYEQFYKQRDFLAIYRKESAENSQGAVFIGKPYDSSVELYFTDNLLPGCFIDIAPSDRQYVFLVPWTTNPANQAIPTGSYYSSFHDNVLIEDVEISIDTKVEFKVN